jgi:mono/diheme cytochrome c family protein
LQSEESVKVLAGILVGLLLVIGAIGFIVWSGSYNVAATNPPGRFEKKFAAFALNRAIQRRAPVRTNPFSKPEDIRAGLAHYKENCVDCHGAPGVEESEFGEGLNPPAPDLTLPAVQRMRDGELFWVVSNGIRMTGMPAFAPTHKEDEIWKIVAFVRHLPEITKEEQQALKASREEETGHHEAESGGATAGKEEQKASPEGQRAPTHPPGEKPHKN